ncbi:iron complex transport system ATP-binding protein [Gordonia malaquae]|uniref:Putative ABC transporter ATP-binding protein n=1 Tax=Gordonia malaquae NBRC 108250 TaxID=1223542 RepID=M3UY75_GORML|nr:ABC transporter ATP-binding protein [Gordonia malaquae]GAC80732.1 putative ABC transporter ATP-binding protein [Gordonia malaquae NBRC 108250]SED49240.1 iron complex transport system ATP-binding protein [Gordonia malaquae]
MTTTNPILSAHGLSVGYNGDIVVADLDVDIAAGEVTTIIGPNGCGKSTLLRTLSKLLTPAAGHVRLDGVDLASLRPRDIARRLAMLPQNPIAPSGLSVLDLVSRGRSPYQSWYRQWSSDDEEAVSRAMRLTSILDLADRPVEDLSGGQRQRAWIAMTLAQDTDLVLLDEPTTYLDLAHAVDVLDLVDELRDDHGKTVVMVLHDLNLAARSSDHLIVMRDGVVLTRGTPAEVLTVEVLRDAFGLSAQVLTDPETGGPLVVPTVASARRRKGTLLSKPSV